jgi:hypothetical protein
MRVQFSEFDEEYMKNLDAMYALVIFLVLFGMALGSLGTIGVFALL